jgi:hypothetical protein
VKFHVHTYASLLAKGVMLFQNVTRKRDQPIMYASRLLNRAQQKYNTIEKKALVMFFALHKLRHYLLSNKFIFYVNLWHWFIWSTNHKF